MRLRKTNLTPIHYYTDGSSMKNHSGWSAVQIDDMNVVSFQYSYYHDKTNNQMELMGILYVLKLAQMNPDCFFYIYSDSSYAINSLSTWLRNWKRNGWKNSKKKIIKNYDLIRAGDRIMETINNYQFIHVKGHNDNYGNELADAIATNNKQKYKKVIKQFGLTDYTDDNWCGIVKLNIPTFETP